MAFIFCEACQVLTERHYEATLALCKQSFALATLTETPHSSDTFDQQHAEVKWLRQKCDDAQRQLREHREKVHPGVIRAAP